MHKIILIYITYYLCKWYVPCIRLLDETIPPSSGLCLTPSHVLWSWPNDLFRSTGLLLSVMQTCLIKVCTVELFPGTLTLGSSDYAALNDEEKSREKRHPERGISSIPSELRVRRREGLLNGLSHSDRMEAPLCTINPRVQK